jgi:hypothetical protein
MDWKARATSTVLGLGDWVAGRLLQHTDPYLTWYDLSGFAGAVLPQNGQLPMVERRPEETPTFRTNARSRVDVAALVRAVNARNGPVTRFEVGPSQASEAGLGQSSEPRIARQVRDAASRVSYRDVLAGFIDFGCAFAHRQFRRADGGSRVLAVWDQAWRQAPSGTDLPLPPGVKPLHWRLPDKFFYGAEAHRRFASNDGSDLDLDDYIAQFSARAGRFDEEACYRYSGHAAVAGRRATHGTHVMDIATGHPNPLRHLPGAWSAATTAAPQDADIVFVNLPHRMRGRQVGGLLRANVYDALRYVTSCAKYGARVVVNLSYGGHAGPHDGTSVLEDAIDDFLRRKRTQLNLARLDLVVAAGNSRQSRMHASATIGSGGEASFAWNNLPDDPSDSFVEIWLPPGAEGVEITVQPPHGPGSATTRPAGAHTLLSEDGKPMAALIFPEKVCQSTRGTMALLAVAPTLLGRPAGGARSRAPYGRWVIRVANKGSSTAQVHAWCELDRPAFGSLSLPRQAQFTSTATSLVDTDGTLNSMAHGDEPWVVGACAGRGGMSRYSSTGPGRQLPGRARRQSTGAPPSAPRGPDAVRPGDESVASPGVAAAATVGCDTVRLSGTSVAAAVLTRELLGATAPRPGRARELLTGRGPGTMDRGAVARDDSDEHPDKDLLP